jgi:hypothetical protein
MSDSSPAPTIAYLAQGRVRLKAGAAPPRTVDSLYGNSIREKAVRAQQKHSWKAAGNDSSPFSGAVLWGKQEEGMDLVPKSWQLCRRSSKGESKVLAAGVLAYDIGADGTIVYTNGSALFLLHPDGRKVHVLNEALIEQVFFVPA